MNVYLLLNQDHRETPKTAETRGVPRAVPMHHDANQPPKQQGRQGETSLLRGSNYQGGFSQAALMNPTTVASSQTRLGPKERPRLCCGTLLPAAARSKVPSTQMHPCKPIEFYFL